MAITDVSLAGVKEYGESIGGVHQSTHASRHLRDLEALVDEMCKVRSGSLTSEDCSCHGNMVDSNYYSSKTGCSHSRSSYGKTTISLGELAEAMDDLRLCKCNSVKKDACFEVSIGCIANPQCDCESRCGCNND